MLRMSQQYQREIKAMNDLHEKKENDTNGSDVTGGNSYSPDSYRGQLYYKKLSAYLVLLYQEYLQREILLEPEIKAAIWRMVQLQEDFPIKIRMMQLELLSFETDTIDGEWDAVKDSLFPVKDHEVLGSLTAQREKQIQEYKDAIIELLRSIS